MPAAALSWSVASNTPRPLWLSCAMFPASFWISRCSADTSMLPLLVGLPPANRYSNLLEGISFLLTPAAALELPSRDGVDMAAWGKVAKERCADN